MLTGIIIAFLIVLLVAVFWFCDKKFNEMNQSDSSNRGNDGWWSDEVGAEYQVFIEKEKRDLNNKPVSDENERLTPSSDKQLCPEDEIADYVAEIEGLSSASEDTIRHDARYSISVNLDDYDSNPLSIDKLDPTFQEQLLKLISENGLTNVEFYNAAWIDRKLFSAINSNKYYKPKKETAVACCFGLRLSLSEAEKLLKAAGYALSDSILWDRIIRYCLEHDINRIEQVNQILDKMGEKCIGC